MLFSVNDHHKIVNNCVNAVFRLTVYLEFDLIHFPDIGIKISIILIEPSNTLGSRNKGTQFEIIFRAYQLKVIRIREVGMKMFAGVLAFAVSLSSVADAATILSHEPPKGKLPAGESVLVDNGKCPHGKILEVTGGGNRSLTNGGMRGGSNRRYQCVVRPAG